MLFRSLHSIFVGGGTPTLLPSADLVRVIEALRERFDFEDDIEITTEANPDSVNPQSLAELRSGGFNRISFGMQSSAEHVLKVLDRTHRAGRALDAVREAQQAGFDNLNIDLIFGTPGETVEDLRRTLDDVVCADVQHVSAYALIVEEGTRLARQIQRGWKPDSLRPGDSVTLTMHPLKDGSRGGQLVNATLPDGRTVGGAGAPNLQE